MTDTGKNKTSSDHIFFTNWWSLGNNCIEGEIKTGIIADDKIGEDLLICNQNDLKLFKEKIAINLYTKEEKDKCYKVIQNSNDPFLSDQIQYNFDDTFIYAAFGAKIKQVLYSSIFECYLIEFSEESCEATIYSAAIIKNCNKSKTREDIKFQILNPKPENIKKKTGPENLNDEY